MIATQGQLTEALLAALREVPGLRPATPATRHARRWWAWDVAAMALSIDEQTIEVRLVALALPLAPLLRRAAAAMRPALDDSRWKTARLRLVVTDIDARALAGMGNAECWDAEP